MESNSEDLVVVVVGYKGRTDKLFNYIPGMMSQIGNHIDFVNYTNNKLGKISGIMTRNLEYNIDEAAYGSFHYYISARMELPFFFNTRRVQYAMDRARINSAIQTFKPFAIQGENGGVCTVANLKNINTVSEEVTGRA